MKKRGTINGEPFWMEHRKGGVTLYHDCWSLQGTGHDIDDAIRDMSVDARVLVAALSRRKHYQMSDDAIAMLEFARSLTPDASFKLGGPESQAAD